MRILLFLAAMLLSCAQVLGQTPASDAENIRDISPDGQFAMRIVYDEESNKEYPSGSDEIAKEAIRSVDLVTLPSKKSITNHVLTLAQTLAQFSTALFANVGSRVRTLGLRG